MVKILVQNIRFCLLLQIMASKGAMLNGAKSKFWRHFENILLAGSPGAVPTAFLHCQSSVCCTCCQQQVRTCVQYNLCSRFWLEIDVAVWRIDSIEVCVLGLDAELSILFLTGIYPLSSMNSSLISVSRCHTHSNKNRSKQAHIHVAGDL